MTASIVHVEVELRLSHYAAIESLHKVSSGILLKCIAAKLPFHNALFHFPSHSFIQLQTQKPIQCLQHQCECTVRVCSHYPSVPDSNLALKRIHLFSSQYWLHWTFLKDNIFRNNYWNFIICEVTKSKFFSKPISFQYMKLNFFILSGYLTIF